MRTAGIRSQNSEVANQRPEVRRKLLMLGLSPVILCLTLAFSASAQEDMLKMIETKRIELKEKEDHLKREEQRLNILKKAVEEKIETYTKLLAQVEATIKKVEQVKGEKLENVVKAYEAMPPEDAAARLSVLDDVTALLIMSRMKSKKAGAIIALMEPRKAAAITKSMTTLPLANPEK
jgi:flagellar motility protein MotE (MotC chaperone)